MRDARVGCRHLGRRGAQRLDGGRHVAGVEGAGDLQRDDARAGGRLGGERLQRVERAGGDELAAAVVVRGGEVELGEAGDDGCLVAADDGAHARSARRRRPRPSRGRGCRRGAARPLRSGCRLPPRRRTRRPSGRRRRRCGSRSGSAFHDSRLAATMSGCATCVSRMRSASHSVPAATRSTPDHSEYAARRSAAPSRSSQGVRKPGDWEPCPGKTAMITYPSCQGSGGALLAIPSQE